MRSCVTRCPLIRTALIAILVGFCASRAAAQGIPNQKREFQPTPRFNADATLVLIPVTVTDASNRFVLGLQRQDFRLLEDGAEQRIAHMSGEDAPLVGRLGF